MKKQSNWKRGRIAWLRPGEINGSMERFISHVLKIKKHLYALGALFILHLLVFARLIFLTPEKTPFAVIPFDFANQYSRWLVYIGDSFAAGIVPLWVPYVGAGTPFFINPQTQMYSPVTLVVATLLGYSQRTAQLQSVMMLFFGGVGAYLLAYSLWRTRWSALVTATCFTFTSAIFTNLEHMTITNSLALMPWLFWATATAATQKNQWAFPVLAFLIYFLITSGYPAVIAMTMFWVGLFTLYLLYFSPDQGTIRLRSLALYAASWVLGLGLSAIHWLPILIHRLEFTRGSPLPAEVALSGGSLSFKHLWGMLFLFLPNHPLPGTEIDISMRGLYFGALALPLALAALLLIKERIVSALLFLSVTSFLLACGGMFFGRLALHILLPIMNFSRFPAVDSRGLMMLGLVLLAGGGAKLLQENSQPARTLIIRACVGLIGLMILGLIVFRGVLAPAVYNDIAVNFITAEILFIGLAIFALRKFVGRKLIVSMLALLALELGTCVLANPTVVGHSMSAGNYRQLVNAHRPQFTPEAANVPRFAEGTDLVNEEAGRGYAEKTFYLTDYNNLRLKRFDRLIAAGFTDWLTNGPRVITLPLESQAANYTEFQQQARLVGYVILSYSPNQVSYSVNADQDSLLVFNEIFFPGWRAMVDGQSQPMSEVSGGLRGLRVRAGQHVIVTTFKPTSFYLGLVVSLVSGALFLAWCFLIIYRARRPLEQRTSGK